MPDPLAAIESTDYTGRQVDVLVYQDNTTVAQPLIQALVPSDNPSGLAVAGIRKLAQRYILKLRTARGSIPYSPNEGNDFVTLAKNGRIRTRVDGIQQFAIALLLIGNSMRAEQLGGDLADESLQSLQPVDVQISRDVIKTVTRLTSQAGTSFTILAPLPVSI